MQNSCRAILANFLVITFINWPCQHQLNTENFLHFLILKMVILKEELTHEHCSIYNQFKIYLTERPQGARLLPNRWIFTLNIFKKKPKKNSKKTQKKITFEFKHISVFFKHTSYLMIIYYESYHSTPHIFTWNPKKTQKKTKKKSLLNSSILVSFSNITAI